MKRTVAVIGGLAVGVAAMLAILQPWKRAPKSVSSVPASTSPEVQPKAREQAHLALTALKAGNLQEAQVLLAKAASLDPELFEVPHFQGHIEMLKGDHAAARRSYTEALKRQPRHAGALASRAAARFELTEYGGALEDATAALEIDSSEPDAFFTRAAAYGAIGRWEESLRDWTSYLALRPKDADGWVNRGNAHDRMGSKAAAATDWKEALKLAPSMSDHLVPLIKDAER
jgi:tetratricopeptide (TPR) repeat protein